MAPRPKRKLPDRIQVRFTDDELNGLQRYADLVGRSLSDIVRQAAMGVLHLNYTARDSLAVVRDDKIVAKLIL